MRGVLTVLGILAGVTVAAPSEARQSVTMYKYDVSGDPASGDMEVVARFVSAAGLAGHWCGAGEYAGRYLRADSQTRIYLSRPRGPSLYRSTGSGVGFTLDPDAALLQQAKGKEGLLSDTVVGASLTVGKARSLCDFTIDN